MLSFVIVALTHWFFLVSGLTINSNVLAWFTMASNPIVIEFIIGYIIASYFNEIIKIINRVGDVYYNIINFFIITLLYLEVKTLPMFDDLHMGVGFIPSVYLFIYSIKLFNGSGMKLPRFLSFTSRVSYSIYLLHMPVIFIVITISKLIFGEMVFDFFFSRVIMFFVSLSVSWFVGYLFYSSVEERLSKVLKKLFLRVKDNGVI